jgi:hypothetical protein
MQQNGTTFTTRYSKNKEGTSTDTWSKTIEKDGSVTTEATGCTFDKFFGAGYGGASSFKLKFYDATGPKFNDLIANYNGDRGKYFDGNDKTYKSSYGNKGPGVATDFDYEFFVWSSGSVGARFFVNYTTFSLAQTNNVISQLDNCIVNGNFYGGGSLGVVSGNASSTLNDCIVKGSVYGGGFSASIPSVPVRNEGFEELPAFNANSGFGTCCADDLFFFPDCCGRASFRRDGRRIRQFQCCHLLCDDHAGAVLFKKQRHRHLSFRGWRKSGRRAEYFRCGQKAPEGLHVQIHRQCNCRILHGIHD